MQVAARAQPHGPHAALAGHLAWDGLSYGLVFAGTLARCFKWIITSFSFTNYTYYMCAVTVHSYSGGVQHLARETRASTKSNSITSIHHSCHSPFHTPTHHSHSSPHCLWWKVVLEFCPDNTTVPMGPHDTTPNHTVLAWLFLSSLF